MEHTEMEHTEIEVRFLDIDKPSLVKMLGDLGADDHGEVMLEEAIVYDKDLKWPEEGRFVRLRKSGDVTKITYKEHSVNVKDGAREVEFEVEDLDKGVYFLEKIGLLPFRRQQKKRHTFHLGEVVIDIDTWPRIPTYVELEGPSHESLKEVADKLGLAWDDAVYEDARHVIEKIYGVPVGSMRWFTFDRFE